MRILDARGRLAAEVVRINGVKQGWAQCYHFNGTVSKEGTYRNDLKDGAWAHQDSAGRRTAILNYQQGRFHGSCQWWASSGRLVNDEHYVSGRLHGPLRRWFSDGSPRLEVEYVNGKAEGPYKRWVRDGDTTRHGSLIVGHYLHGLSSGTWYSLTGDGRIVSEGRMEKGARAGTWRYWDREGRSLREDEF